MSDKLLYNEDLKRRFLNSLDCKENTVKFSEHVLSKAYKTEIDYDRDICNADTEMFENFIRSLEAKSLASLTVQNSIINKYIEFAIREGYVPSRINIAELFPRELLRKYVMPIALDNKHITEKELEEVIKDCANYSDACMISLFFDLVKGVRFCELTNLRKTDVNFETNELKLRNEKDEIVRTAKVSERSIKLIQDTITEEMYIPKNGEEAKSNRKNYYVANTIYVFRPIGKNKTGKLDKQIISRRVSDIVKHFGNPFLKAQNLWMSGVIHFTKNYIQEKELTELNMYNYIEICELINYNPDQWHNIKTNVESYL